MKHWKIKFLVLLLFAMTSMFAITNSVWAQSETVDEFKKLRTRWAENFLGSSGKSFDDTLKKRVISTNTHAKKYWDNMITDGARTSLWSDLGLDHATDAQKKILGPKIRASYQRLFTMAKAYRLRGGKYQNDKKLLAAIVDGMTFLNDKYYKAGVQEWGNWWHWELAIPRDVHNILILIFDDVSNKAVIDGHVKATRYFTPKATHLGASKGAKNSSNSRYRKSTGGNRTDNAQVVLIRGILDKNETEIQDAIKALSAVLQYVDSSDGFYKDGSFIQHYDIAYNGTYGNVLLGGLGLQLNLVAGSKWQPSDPIWKKIYPIIFQSYEPLLYRGAMLDFVNGRAISRKKEQGRQVGYGVLRSILHYIDSALEPDKTRLKSLVKTLVQRDGGKNFLSSISNVGSYQKAWEILNDAKVVARPELTGHFSFASMDRAVHRRKGWLFSLAMHSSRVGNYECMNKENRKGWYTGDGMTYLYNGHIDHYYDYWPVVDSTRLEGTTVVDEAMTPCGGQHNQIKGKRKKGMNWVGTLSLGHYGVAGMDFVNAQGSLTAKKSYFMFDDEVVMIGSDVSFNTLAPAVTVLANRKVPSTATSSVYVDGVHWKEADNDGAKKSVQAKRMTTFSIRNSGIVGSDVGYVFFDPALLLLKREKRQGDWSDIGKSSGVVNASFVTAEIGHKNSKSYAYAMVPNATAATLKAYAQDPKLVILQNDATAHAVKDSFLKLFAANVWKSGEVTFDNAVTVYQQMSLMVHTHAKGFKVAVADPLQTQSTLTIAFKKPVNILSDPEGRVTPRNKSKLDIDVSALKGRGYVFELKLK